MGNVDANAKLAPVKVWRCKNTECKAWIRDELTTGTDPTCPLCKGPMIRSIKHLPELINKIKRQKKEKVSEETV
jgi:hypothetical protein